MVCNKHQKKIGQLAFIVIFVFIFLVPLFSAFALEGTSYNLLAELPLEEGGGVTSATDAQTYIKGMVQLVIAVASVLAVLKIILAGIKYMSSDAFQGKSEGKKDIQNAIWGLVLAMSAWLILYTVNPQLTTLDLRIEKLPIQGELETDLGATFANKEKARGEAGCAEPCVAVQQRDEPFPNNPPNGRACEGAVCFVNSDLYEKLGLLHDELNGDRFERQSGKIEYPWVVTEMMPPTVFHSQPCQKKGESVAGMCIDASIKSQLKCPNQETCSRAFLGADAVKIGEFIEAASEVGLYVEYEVPNEERRRGLTSFRAVSDDSVIVVLPRQDPNCSVCHLQAISEHFSVYLNRSVKR